MLLCATGVGVRGTADESFASSFGPWASQIVAQCYTCGKYVMVDFEPDVAYDFGSSPGLLSARSINIGLRDVALLTAFSLTVRG